MAKVPLKRDWMGLGGGFIEGGGSIAEVKVSGTRSSFVDFDFGHTFSGVETVSTGGFSPHDSEAPAAAPDATMTEPDATPPTVVVTAERPSLHDVDEEHITHVDYPSGGEIVPGPPYPSGRPAGVRSLPAPNPSTSFLGPEPAPQLPQVTITAKPPTVPEPAPLAPPAFGLFPRLLGSLSFAFHSQDLNVGEDARVYELIRAEQRSAAGRLQPVKPSVGRLPEPVETVTVRSTRISDRLTAGTSRAVPSGALWTDLLRRLPAPFISQPTSRLKPTPQTTRRPSSVRFREKLRAPASIFTTAPTRFLRPGLDELVEPAARPEPRPQPGPIPLIPLVPGITPVGVLPGQTPIGSIEPISVPRDALAPQPQPAFQGQCSCPSTQTKTHKKRRRRIRTKCYRGTFIEKGNRVNKTRLEEVPCQQDLRTKKAAKYRAKPKTTQRKKYAPPGAFPGYKPKKGK